MTEWGWTRSGDEPSALPRPPAKWTALPLPPDDGLVVDLQPVEGALRIRGGDDTDRIYVGQVHYAGGSLVKFKPWGCARWRFVERQHVVGLCPLPAHRYCERRVVLALQRSGAPACTVPAATRGARRAPRS